MKGITFNTRLLPIVLCLHVGIANASYDSRSVGMGGVGVASASHLTASFHNPALAAKYSDNDNFGMILPTLNLNIHDGDDMVSKFDDFEDIDDVLQMDPDNEELTAEWRKALAAMDDGKVTSNVNLGMVVAVPNKYLATNLFVSGKVSAIAIANVDDRDLTSHPINDDLYSTVTGLVGGTVDVGFTFAREVELYGHDIYLGFSPKFQQIYSYYHTEFIDNDDNDESDPDYMTRSTFNVDVGLAYEVSENINVGFSALNLIERELETDKNHMYSATYVVGPEYRVGADYRGNWFNVAMDVDLNRRHYFKEYSHKTQFARIGGELNGWDWVAVRAGYQHSLTDSAEDIVSLGFGFTPFGVFGLDLAGQVGKDSNYGVSMQMVLKI